MATIVTSLPDASSAEQKPGKWTATDEDRAKVAAMFELALAEGRHSNELRVLCHGFGGRERHWCDGIYFGKEGIPDICRECYEVMRAGEGAKVARVRRVARLPQAYVTDLPLHYDLIGWALRHFQDAAVHYEDRDDQVWRARVLASIVRRRAEVEGSDYVVRVACSDHGPTLARLGKYIGKAGGYPIDPATTFEEWVWTIREFELGEVRACGR